MANEYLNNKHFESIILSFQFYKRQKTRYEHILHDLTETHNRRKQKYKDNLRQAAVDKAMEEHRKSCYEFEQFQSQLAYSFYLLSQNIANYAKFNGVDIDDAIQEGVLICFQKIDLFDPRKGKAFNYMTTCVINHLRQLYRSAKNYSELKKRFHIFLLDKHDNIYIKNGKEQRSQFDKETLF